MCQVISVTVKDQVVTVADELQQAIDFQTGEIQRIR